MEELKGKLDLFLEKWLCRFGYHKLTWTNVQGLEHCYCYKAQKRVGEIGETGAYLVQYPNGIRSFETSGRLMAYLSRAEAEEQWNRRKEGRVVEVLIRLKE